MQAPERALAEAILEFYRRELRARYDLRNMRRFEAFDAIPDAHLSALRSFFLAQIYPPAPRRRQLDAAFDHLGGVMHSPRRLRPLMGTAIRSALRLGARFPAAISAGLATIDAYRETRVLEALMLEHALERGLSPEDLRNRRRVLSLMANVPEEVVLRLIRDVLALFRALSNVKMLETAITFMEICRDVIGRRTDLYSQEDMDGFSFGIEVIQEGLDLFRPLAPEQLEAIIQGIEAVELEWYQELKEAAGERP